MGGWPSWPGSSSLLSPLSSSFGPRTWPAVQPRLSICPPLSSPGLLHLSPGCHWERVSLNHVQADLSNRAPWGGGHLLHVPSLAHSWLEIISLHSSGQSWCWHTCCQPALLPQERCWPLHDHKQTMSDPPLQPPRNQKSASNLHRRTHEKQQSLHSLKPKATFHSAVFFVNAGTFAPL